MLVLRVFMILIFYKKLCNWVIPGMVTVFGVLG